VGNLRAISRVRHHIGQKNLIGAIEASKRYNLKTIRFEKEVNVIDHRMIWHRNHGADPAIAWLRLVLRTLVADLQ
jgi:hypothetical protein